MKQFKTSNNGPAHEPRPSTSDPLPTATPSALLQTHPLPSLSTSGSVAPSSASRDPRKLMPPNRCTYVHVRAHITCTYYVHILRAHKCAHTDQTPDSLLQPCLSTIFPPQQQDHHCLVDRLQLSTNPPPTGVNCGSVQLLRIIHGGGLATVPAKV